MFQCFLLAGTGVGYRVSVSLCINRKGQNNFLRFWDFFHFWFRAFPEI